MNSAQNHNIGAIMLQMAAFITEYFVDGLLRYDLSLCHLDFAGDGTVDQGGFIFFIVFRFVVVW